MPTEDFIDEFDFAIRESYPFESIMIQMNRNGELTQAIRLDRHGDLPIQVQRVGIKSMSWVYLVLAIIFEVGGTTAMKLSDSFTKWIPSVAIFVLYGLSLVGMSLAMKRIEMSIVYAVWSGLGMALIAVIGVMYFNEEIDLIKIVSLLLIVAGVVGLNLTGGGH